MRPPIALALAASAVAACATDVHQDAHTGTDGRASGARSLALVGNHARARDIVTYPGGDRVDWRALTLPARGELDLALSWRAPRPHLALRVDIFDELGREVGRSRRVGDREHARVDGVGPGRVLVRVYAVGRGDAGRYTLDVTFTPARELGGDPVHLPIADPPPLPEVPPFHPCPPDGTFVLNAPLDCNRPPRCTAETPPGWPCEGPRQP